MWSEFSMNTKMFKLGLMVVLGFCITPFVAEAHSAKAFGMGDTGVAYPQDAITPMYNPANAAEIGNRIDSVVGAIYAPYAAKIRDNPIPAANEKVFGRRTWNFVGAFGINRQLCNNLAANLTITNRFFHKTHYNKSNVLVGRKEFGHGYERYTAALALAYTWQCHHLGIALDINVGRHKVIGLENFDSPIFSVAPGHVTNRGYDWNYGIGVTVGWLWDVTDCFKVGVKFTPETKTARFHKYKGFIPQRGQINRPQEMIAGLSYRFLECATFTFDFHYIWVSRIRAAHNPLATNPFIVLLGTKHGSAFGLRDEKFFKFGLDYAINDCLVVRAGYIYVVPNYRKKETFVDILTNIPERNVFTLGSSFNWRCWDITTFYLHGYKHRVHGPVPAFLGGGRCWYEKSFNIFGIGIGREF